MLARLTADRRVNQPLCVRLVGNTSCRAHCVMTIFARPHETVSTRIMQSWVSTFSCPSYSAGLIYETLACVFGQANLVIFFYVMWIIAYSLQSGFQMSFFFRCSVMKICILFNTPKYICTWLAVSTMYYNSVKYSKTLQLFILLFRLVDKYISIFILRDNIIY